MKMIAAVKYARAERELRPARPYGKGTQAFYENLKVPPPEKKEDHLVVVMSSDRGLCGGIHSSLTKAVKADFPGLTPEQNVKLILVGDKSRAQVSRVFNKNVMLTVNDIGKKPPTFADASVLAQHILASGYKYNQGEIYFNWFKSVVSYRTQKLPIFSEKMVASSSKINTYDSLDEDVLKGYMEYSLASLLYYALKEGACSEQSARMTAMDGASKNAGEMIEKLTLYYNRTRQAVITRELIEIISGAAAI